MLARPSYHLNLQRALSWPPTRTRRPLRSLRRRWGLHAHSQSSWWCTSGSAPAHPDASTGYWRFTKQRVTQGLCTGNTRHAADILVREMDPNSVVRYAEIGRSLATNDAVSDGLCLLFGF